MSDFDTLNACEPGTPEWRRRLATFMADESTPKWWWLSFVDTDRSAPPDEQVSGGGGFAGVCIIPAPNVVFAARVAHLLGCNPGGEIAGEPLPVPPGMRPRHQYVGRLFGAELADVDEDQLFEPLP